jgi:Cysteine rich repeat
MRIGLGISVIAAIALMSGVAAFGPNASAQTAVSKNVAARLSAASEKLKAACSGDISKFCKSVTPGEGRVIFCMMAYEDQLSEKCDYALYDASRNLQHSLELVSQVANACWNDIEKHCSNIPAGGGRIAQCLINNKKSVARACRRAIEKFPAAR